MKDGTQLPAWIVLQQQPSFCSVALQPGPLQLPRAGGIVIQPSIFHSFRGIQAGYTASPASMESEAVSRRAETAGNRPGWECRKQDGQQSERGAHGALDEMMMRRSWTIVLVRQCAPAPEEQKAAMMYWSWEPVYLAPYARRGVGPSMKRYMNLSRLMEDGCQPRVSKVAGPRIGGQIPFFRPQAELSAPAPSLRFALYYIHARRQLAAAANL